MVDIQSSPKDYRSGFVALVGRPNVGKSTLINKLVGEKVAITSPVAQTTRNRLKAILTTPKAQLVMVDTPGIHKPHHLLGERLVKSARSVIGQVDAALLLLDGSCFPGRGDVYIINILKKYNLSVLVVLNKWDLVSDKDCLDREEAYKSLVKELKWPIYKCSAFKGIGINELIQDLEPLMPKGPYLYPPDMVSDQPEKFLLSELIREQVLLNTREEIPHSVAVNIDKIEEISSKSGKKKSEGYMAILATIFVERKSQKGILIGKGGEMLKRIGKASRLQMQTLIAGSVYLEIFVKVSPNWRSKPSSLAELGYQEE